MAIYAVQRNNKPGNALLLHCIGLPRRTHFEGNSIRETKQKQRGEDLALLFYFQEVER